jgi:hypothetical protein
MLIKVSSKGLPDTHNFIINYNNFQLPYDKNYEIALVQYSMPYSWHNVNAIYNNNQITITVVGGASTTYTFPNGNYSIEELNDYLVGERGDNSVNIQANYTTGRVEFVLDNNLKIETSDNPAINPNPIVNTILGFSYNEFIQNITGVRSTISAQNNADLNRGVDAVSVHCDLVDAKNSLLNDKYSTSVFSFVPKTLPQSVLAENISNPIYVGISSHGQIHSVQYSIRDNRGNLLDLQGESVTLTFHMREHQEILHN